MRGLETPQRIHRVGYTPTLQLEVTKLETRITADCRFDHSPPHGGPCQTSVPLVRRNRRGNPENAFEINCVRHLPGHQNVAEVGRVDSTAEDPYPRSSGHLVRRRGPGGARLLTVETVSLATGASSSLASGESG